jgi:hypothetical protein
MNRLYTVKCSFVAKSAWVGGTSRIFNPGETLWWDKDGHADLFKVDGFKWHPDDVIQFSQSIEPFESSPFQPAKNQPNWRQSKRIKSKSN